LLDNFVSDRCYNAKVVSSSLVAFVSKIRRKQYNRSSHLQTKDEIRVGGVSGSHYVASGECNLKCDNSIAGQANLVCEPRVASSEGESTDADFGNTTSSDGDVERLQYLVNILRFLTSPDFSGSGSIIEGYLVEASRGDLDSRRGAPPWIGGVSS
jgi:hypothetical protein